MTREYRSIETSLRTLLVTHRDCYNVLYGPDALTDHGPMAALALVGLGKPLDVVVTHTQRYQARLDALGGSRETIDRRHYPDAIGRFDAYAPLIGYFDREIADHGADATLHRHLPSLISGWVKDAYHATIRLGYGIEFGVPSEISAGLAYLAALGPDSRLAAAGEAHADDPLASARNAFRKEFGEGTFSQRYDRVVRSGAIAACLPDLTDALRRASRAALGVFDSTHAFFALHLVTGSHAMRICTPFAGPSAERLLWAGVVAGYLCIGAPTIAADAQPHSVAPDLAIRDPEHLIKVAYTARSQAAAFDDPSYVAVVERYLL